MDFLAPHNTFDENNMIQFLDDAVVNGEKKCVVFQSNGKLIIYDTNPMQGN